VASEFLVSRERYLFILFLYQRQFKLHITQILKHTIRRLLASQRVFFFSYPTNASILTRVGTMGQRLMRTGGQVPAATTSTWLKTATESQTLASPRLTKAALPNSNSILV
jgi:hypothetical protein